MMRLNVIAVFFCLLSACIQSERLPVYGNKQVNSSGDSIDYTIPAFSLTDQDGNTINENITRDKVHVADFFFTSCPSICPKMKAEMFKVYEKYKANPDVVLLSYSIDPSRDSVGKLKEYEAKLGIESSKWHLLTGNKDSIYKLANDYLISAEEDPDAPGGHVHSGNFILVDKQRRIRGYYDGTNSESVAKLMTEMEMLLKEK